MYKLQSPPGRSEVMHGDSLGDKENCCRHYVAVFQYTAYRSPNNL